MIKRRRQGAGTGATKQKLNNNLLYCNCDDLLYVYPGKEIILFHNILT